MSDIQILSKILRANVAAEATQQERGTACALAAASELVDQVSSEAEAVELVRQSWHERYRSESKGERADPWPLSGIEPEMADGVPPLSELPFMKG